MDDKPALIIDSGAFTTKGGFATDDHPRCIFQSVVGRPKYLHGEIGKEPYDVFIGDDATCRSDDFELWRPMSEGRVSSWDDMERLWHHSFYRELRVAPEEGPILLSCVPQCPLAVKERICQIMFETFNVPSLFLASSSLLSLFATGRQTGVVVDSGYSATYISPIDEGSPICCAHIKYDLAGKHISETLSNLLCEKYSFTDSWRDRCIIEDIKKRYCFVTKDDICLKQQTFTLPDGRKIMLGDEVHSCMESMFRPSLVGDSDTIAPLPHEIKMAVVMCDPDVRDTLLGSILVCGGNSMIPGFATRVEEETRRQMEGKYAVRVHAGEETGAHAVCAWRGGSVVAGMSGGIQEYWLPRKLYEECGPKIIKTKFL